MLIEIVTTLQILETESLMIVPINMVKATETDMAVLTLMEMAGQT